MIIGLLFVILIYLTPNVNRLLYPHPNQVLYNRYLFPRGAIEKISGYDLLKINQL